MDHFHPSPIFALGYIRKGELELTSGHLLNSRSGNNYACERLMRLPLVLNDEMNSSTLSGRDAKFPLEEGRREACVSGALWALLLSCKYVTPTNPALAGVQVKSERVWQRPLPFLLVFVYFALISNTRMLPSSFVWLCPLHVYLRRNCMLPSSGSSDMRRTPNAISSSRCLLYLRRRFYESRIVRNYTKRIKRLSGPSTTHALLNAV